MSFIKLVSLFTNHRVCVETTSPCGEGIPISDRVRNSFIRDPVDILRETGIRRSVIDSKAILSFFFTLHSNARSYSRLLYMNPLNITSPFVIPYILTNSCHVSLANFIHKVVQAFKDIFVIFTRSRL